MIKQIQKSKESFEKRFHNGEVNIGDREENYSTDNIYGKIQDWYTQQQVLLLEEVKVYLQNIEGDDKINVLCKYINDLIEKLKNQSMDAGNG